jgi:hypothetical protein
VHELFGSIQDHRTLTLRGRLDHYHHTIGRGAYPTCEDGWITGT